MATQQELQNGVNNAFAKLCHGISNDIDCAFIAKVTKYDGSKHTCNLLPLANTSYGEKKAQYEDVPVSDNCYKFDEWAKSVSSMEGMKIPKPSMKIGAIVVAVVLDHDTDDWDGTASTYTPDSRIHDANDSVVIGVL